MRALALCLCLSTMLALPAATVAAGDDDDHDRALEAVRRGAVLSLAEILAIVERRFGGRVIDVEFERDDGRYVYEMELVGAKGRLYEVSIDAETGAVIEQDVDDDDGDYDDGDDDDGDYGDDGYGDDGYGDED